MHTVKWFQVFQCITKNSISHPSFIYTQLNDQTVLFLTIQISISHLFGHSLNVKQSIWPIDRTQSGGTAPEPEWTWERRQWKGNPYFPNLQHYWSLTIRLFSVISRTLVRGGGLTTLQRWSQCTQLSHPNVIYWPSTEPSIKRCTCVNKRKKSGSRWLLNNDITRAHTVWVSWGQDVELRASGRQRALGPQWPTVEQPCQDEKEVLLGQYSSLFPSPAQLNQH